ncbi:hypothetical protein [Catalinimonas niigatensis]|nr:hypothetical protein [Catalinimonas niigatensis]WPP49169.1 hypothetical protein PZB72_21105 [Catalinimonas niigatensis]
MLEQIEGVGLQSSFSGQDMFCKRVFQATTAMADLLNFFGLMN